MDLEGAPTIPHDFIVWLDSRYPERCAQPGDTLEDLMFLGGKRDLVRWLKKAYEVQNDPTDKSTEAG